MPADTPMVTRDQVRYAKPDPDLFLTAAEPDRGGHPRQHGGRRQRLGPAGRPARPGPGDRTAVGRLRARGADLLGRLPGLRGSCRPARPPRRGRRAAAAVGNRLRPPAPRASLAAMSRHGTLRASDADRDQIVDRLHKAATEGRIGSDELEQRVSQALKARTYGDAGGDGGRSARATATRSPGPAPAHGRPVGGVSGAGQPRPAAVRDPGAAVTLAWSWPSPRYGPVLMVVLMLVGGTPPRPRASPWAYAARRGARAYGRRGTGRHWA